MVLEGGSLIPRQEKDVTKSEGRKWFVEQRRALGIPLELDGKDVLYLSSHRGVFSTKYESHIRSFGETLRGGEAGDEGKETAFLDLSRGNAEQVIELLGKFVKRADESRESNILPPQQDENAPLPGFVINVIYLPALDADGNSRTSEPSHTYAIDATNYADMLTQLKTFLVERGVVKKNEV